MFYIRLRDVSLPEWIPYMLRVAQRSSLDQQNREGEGLTWGINSGSLRA